MKKSAIRITAFLLVLVLVLTAWNGIFKFKYGDGIYSVKKFYEQKDNSVDVLFVGSSHAFEDFNTGTLWDEYGMAGFVLGASIQPTWNSYYYLKEALKTQTPRLIVLEGYSVALDYEYSDDQRIIKNNFGLKLSADKIESLRTSAPLERFKEFFLEYIQYHTRYRELERGDFEPDQGDPLYADWKGFGCSISTESLESIDAAAITDTRPLFEKSEEYYRRIIELAQSRDIPILIVMSPFAGITVEEQMAFNRAGEIASEYGAAFINCNNLVSDIGLDYTTDMADIGHLNFRGTPKFSRYIGAYITEHYDIPDRRGDERYSSWERDAEYIRQKIYDQELTEITDLAAYADKLRNPFYTLFISFDGEYGDVNVPDLRYVLDRIGIPSDIDGGVLCLQAGELSWKNASKNDEYYLTAGSHDFRLRSSSNSDNGAISCTITADTFTRKAVTNGINILVYDSRTDKIVDMAGLDADNGYMLTRGEE
ncbi:SGNH/GDSL hydrolase family protein [Butyrivibrio sp. MC2013]|uniref:SGNH/GDSL hydrolase family protein n=1 Tax=Butyrivibrio sp. MC2013 TaxID=1280686 RepID=UPI00041EFFBB|nr:SGNH/GDSL hydrolase family protein [Butyrivibrio sp. MC2013]